MGLMNGSGLLLGSSGTAGLLDNGDTRRGLGLRSGWSKALHNRKSICILLIGEPSTRRNIHQVWGRIDARPTRSPIPHQIHPRK
jgi:hypothetical protein